jgi:hypothetical protein
MFCTGIDMTSPNRMNQDPYTLLVAVGLLMYELKSIPLTLLIAVCMRYIEVVPEENNVLPSFIGHVLRVCMQVRCRIIGKSGYPESNLFSMLIILVEAIEAIESI